MESVAAHDPNKFTYSDEWMDGRIMSGGKELQRPHHWWTVLARTTVTDEVVSCSVVMLIVSGVFPVSSSAQAPVPSLGLDPLRLRPVTSVFVTVSWTLRGCRAISERERDSDRGVGRSAAGQDRCCASAVVGGSGQMFVGRVPMPLTNRLVLHAAALSARSNHERTCWR